MPSKSKAKGNRFERQIVDKAKSFDIPAKRAWGSDGRAMGHHEEVDIVLDEKFKIQAKCRKKIGSWMIPNDNVDAQVIKGDRTSPLIVLPLDLFLTMYKLSEWDAIEVLEKEIERLKNKIH